MNHFLPVYRFIGVVIGLALFIPLGAATAQMSVPSIISSNGGGAEATVYVSSNTPYVTRVTATGSAHNTVEYAIIGGVDAARFILNPYTGVLSFKNMPAVAPQSSGQVYDFHVTVGLRDSSGATDQQNLTVMLPHSSLSVSLETSGQCLPVSNDVIRHVYNGIVNSFDLVAPNTYSVQSLSLGGTIVPERYISIWHIPGESLIKIHVDVPETFDTSVDAPITATLSEGAGACTMEISILNGSRETSAPNSSGTPTETPSSGSGAGTSASGSSSGGTAPGSSQETPSTSTSATTSTTTEKSAACTSPHVGIWIVLTILHAISLFIVARVTHISTERGKTALMVASLASFVVLAAAWYWLDACREASWFLGTTTAIAIVGIISTFGGTSQNQRYPMVVDKKE